jgi:mono/diheme cytochrome c family protein
MKSLYLIIVLGLFSWWCVEPPADPYREVFADDAPLAEVLAQLGADAHPFQPDTTLPGVSVARGASLVHTGFAEGPDGKRASKQSANFVCTSCHNTVREDPDLRVADPEARLDYVAEQGIPFLQGTTLYGAINRRRFYNGDYQEKYGELVFAARESLREAIQLCATECAQGRPLEDWEQESVVAYLWTIGLTISDLKLSNEDKTTIENALAGSGDQAAARKLIQSYYLDYSPATFVKPPDNRTEGYEGIIGRPERGEMIYESSCLHCHENARYAFFRLDDSKNTFQYLKKHMDRYTRYSLYQVSRYGTSPMPGKRTYMPNYTKEKMTDQQLEDLRAYIELEASE